MKKAIEDSTKGELENVLAKLVEAGRVSAEDISSCLNQIRAATHECLAAAAEFKENEFQRTQLLERAFVDNYIRTHPTHSVEEMQRTPKMQHQLFFDILRRRFESNLKLREKDEWSDAEKGLCFVLAIIDKEAKH